MFAKRGNFRKVSGLFAIAMMIVSILSVAETNADVIVYSEGFETTNGGYTHTGTLDQWEWGTPDSSFTPGPGAAHAGTKCWGTNLDGHVPLNSDSYLTSPAIAIPALSAGEIARVRFFAWIAVDIMYDRGEFQVSSDGSTWETKAELFCRMLGGWTEYYFDVSDYAGGNIYLRFRCRADGSNTFTILHPYNMAGLYIDDVAIIIAEVPLIKTSVTLEAWEDQYTYASCPWVCTWNGTEYVKDNDVYSTARGPQKEYVDYYNISKPLVALDENYYLQLRETEYEESYTDLVKLISVDHSPEISVASDDEGNIWTYSNPSAPVSAIDDKGTDVTALVANQGDAGFNGYNDDYIILDFGNPDISNGATLILRVKGFQVDGDEGNPTFTQPYIHIQTQDAEGNWVTRNEFYPRWDWSTSAYNLSADLTNSKLIRLYVTSCHEGKYHLIDYVGLDTSAQAPVTTNMLSATSAVHSVQGDVIAAIGSSDNDYAYMAATESITLEFPAPDQTGQARSFVLITEGYYEPMGTYFIYTWDGTQWAQRDGWTVEGSGDQTHEFDLSSWLPDPNGEWKVRIWQDYWYRGAGIDYVGAKRGSDLGIMTSAYDLKKSMNVTSILNASDNNRDEWASSVDYRNRWVEVIWEPFIINTPPTTNPVTITDETSNTPTINWTYNDAEADPQVQYELEVWTGPGGTGSNIWDPPIGSGTASSMVYAGAPLVGGTTCYARVRAFDGNAWGPWSQASWLVPVIPPPQPFGQWVYQGNSFAPMNLDEYWPQGTPPLVWTHEPPQYVTLNIGSGNVLTVDYNYAWYGEETVLFHVTDATVVEYNVPVTFTVIGVPVVEDIPNQITPFEQFDLDDYLSQMLPEDVNWSASEPGNGWTVSIDANNVVTVTAPEGATNPATITFTATNDVCPAWWLETPGNEPPSDSDDATFIPNQPPDCSAARADIGCLWPPDHKMVSISILGVTDPDGDPVSIIITGITSDEATATDKGAGGAVHAPDANGVGTDMAQLRAECSGKGNGRVYVISFTAADGRGGECEGTVEVKVPHDQRPSRRSPAPCEAVDDGQNYDATHIN